MLGVRALKAEAISGGAPAHRAVGARADHRSDRDAADGLDASSVAGRKRGAIEGIDKLAGPEWYAIFKDLHAGLILDLPGNKKEAGKRLEQAYKLDPTRCAWSRPMAAGLSRNGGKDEALEDLSRRSTRCCRTIR